MTWCCEIFEGLSAGQGLRGISVIAATLGSKHSFLLQMRSVDSGIEDDIPGIRTIPVTLVGQQTIFFCPGCGTKLETFYDEEIQSLLREDLLIR